MSTPIASPILVMGATGKQGGSVIRALLKAGRSVRGFVRDPSSPAAQALAAQGVDVVKGEFTDTASLDAALTGVEGVFSVQMGSQPSDPHTEVLAGKALIEAAYRANVRVIVHSSVARAGDQENFIGWDEGRWEPLYWQNKAAVNDVVKTQGFRHWVILKPAMIMEDIVPPQADLQFPTLRERGRFETAIEAETRIDWIAVEDIGAFAAAAFAEPERFHGHEIDLAAESFTLPEVAAKITQVTGKPVSAVTLSKDDALSRPYGELYFQAESWNNVEGYKVDLDAARSWGVPLTTLDQFIEQHRDKFVIG
ncbi:NmrA/HSCARG family protein [Pseudomonas syringae]|uniref:NmrA/HSCARG family protein n=1 Tax=Pseudomonas syringae TaxID=317 RepID=UPI001372AA2F|nr:NmrA/HSCARG family protein [Pseudomonas syringae]NAS96891.1 NmrA family protein [Pseudomonas syringae pv. actinidifoliorum]NAT22653.1 NmrA family protein [Pseudomonas syringae pv. actinidifoliorum]NAT38381.1 NmrA family protein [Pseudomonas syringae pv. actinidifoliorum]NAT64507.1 NmrA family protein [Pseudomonas syringae pv. actinidifoliorum]